MYCWKRHPRTVTLICQIGLVFSLLVLCWVAGCGTGNPFPTGSYDRGAHYNSHGKHHEAVQALETFIRQNPTDSLAARAQYLKALSYMEIDEYPLAAVELKILRKDYPTSELVEDAFFHEGVAYFKQVGRVQRDLTGAYESRSHFGQFLRVFPGSDRLPEVEEYLKRISDLIVEKQLGVADVYRHLGRHKAAMLALETVLEEEPGSTRLDEVLYYLGAAAIRAENYDQARSAFQQLLAEFPESPFAGKSRSGLDDLPTEDLTAEDES
ncbi:MAG: outer membrane protein assembly factor BamD [bacterium]